MGKPAAQGLRPGGCSRMPPRSMAKYAEEHAGVYRRIEVFAKIGDKDRVIDLTEPRARAAVIAAATVREAYDSDAASDYVA